MSCSGRSIENPIFFTYIFTMDKDPDPVLFSLDPDPTCNNGFIKYFYLEQNINQNQQIQA